MGINVVIADDNLIAREGIERILAIDPDLEVVASVGDLEQLTAAVERERPDVVLTDIRMPPTHTDEGIRVANRLRETHPEIGVDRARASTPSPRYALTLLELGLRPARLPAQGAASTTSPSCAPRSRRSRRAAR